MTRRTFRLAATGARIAVGTAVAAACVLGVVAAVAAPLPEVRNEPAAVTVTPVPGDTTLVCNGSFRALGRDATRAGLMVAAGSPRLDRAAADGEVVETTLRMPETVGGSGAAALTGRVQGRQAPLIAATESLDLSAEDLRGFAAAPCREATMRSWLVGGDVSTGAADVVLLSNPGGVPASVDLHVYGNERATSTVIVPPLTQLGMPLASVSAGQKQPVIEVVSSGAPVRATVQSALVRTLDPIGIDLQDGAGGPQRRLALLGVLSAPVAAGDDSTGIVVRMLSPGADATASVRVRAVGTDEVVDEFDVDLIGGVPQEFGLSRLAVGAYDLEIEATDPVVAAARQVARVGTAEDFSWMLPAPEITGTAMLTVPDAVPATLYLRSAGDAPARVVLDGPDGRTVDVPASGSVRVALPAGPHTVSSDTPVHAAVGLRGGEDSPAIAGWPLWAPAATQQPIVVHP